jgi:hypothetical protein
MQDEITVLYAESLNAALVGQAIPLGGYLRIGLEGVTWFLRYELRDGKPVLILSRRPDDAVPPAMPHERTTAP